MTVTLIKANAKHLYEIEVPGGYINVEANTRASAASRARNAGYTVLSVNMVG